MTDTRFAEITWERYLEMVENLGSAIAASDLISSGKIRSVAGVPRGGLILAVLLSHQLGIPLVYVEEATPSTLLVDDLADTGETLLEYRKKNRSKHSAVMFVKPWSKANPSFSLVETDAYIVFPYEKATKESNSVAFRRYKTAIEGESNGRIRHLDTGDKDG